MRKLAQTLLPFGISMLVVAAILEMTLRAFGPYLPGAYRTGPLIEPDSEIGWRHIPSSVTWFRTPEFTTRIVVNSQGRLGPEVEAAKRSATRRVLLLGDSYVGASVPYEETIGGLIPGLFGSPVEVVNDGVSGYGTDQAILALERDRALIQPDVVVLVITIANDIWNNDWALESLRPTYPKPYFDLGAQGELVYERVLSAPSGDQLRVTLARSQLLSVVKTGLIDRLTAPPSDRGHRTQQLAVLAEPSGEWTRAWTITNLLIARLGEISRRERIPTLVVLAPDPCQVHWDSCAERPELAGSTVPQRLLRKAGAAAGLSVLDLLEASRERALRGDRLYFPRDLHWTAAGQRLAAEQISEALRRELGWR